MASTILSSNATLESILYQVNQFVDIGKKVEALEILYSFIASDQTDQWSQDFEKLMIVNIDLAISLEKMFMIEDNLKIFKRVSSVHNSQSFHNVCKHLIKKLNKKFKESLLTVQDPEELFQEIDSMDDAQTFLFNAMDDQDGDLKENFKQNWKNLVNGYLMILKASYKVKTLRQVYFSYSKKFLELLKKYKVKSEFKKLTKKMHSHLNYILKKGEALGINIKSYEVNRDFFKIKKLQLSISEKMGLNKESFQIVKEINKILYSRKSLNKDMSYYFTKLSEIFQSGNFYLFHVEALQQNFLRLIKMKVSEEELKSQASKIVLAALSVNNKSEEFSLNSALIKKYQFLLPNSELKIDIDYMLNKVKQLNILDFCSEEMKNLFLACSGQLDLYDFSIYVEKALEKLPEEYSEYQKKIKENSIFIILKLISNYFINISFEDLKELTHFEKFEKVRQQITKSIFNQEIPMKINFEDQILEFENNEITQQDVMNSNDRVQNLVQEIEYLLVEKENYNYQGEIEELFLKRQEQIQKEASEFKEEEEFLKSMIKEEVVVKKSEEENLREALEKKKQMIDKEINRKILKEKKKCIENLLKIDPNIMLLNKLLIDYNDDEILEIDFNCFDRMQEDIQNDKQKKTNEFLTKKFNLYDFYVRKENKEYIKRFKKFLIENPVDMQEIKTQKEQIKKKKEDLRQKFHKAQSFIEGYKEKMNEQVESEYQQDMISFKSKVNSKYSESILKEARVQYEKLKKQQQESLTQRRGFRGMDNKNRNMERQPRQDQQQAQGVTKLTRSNKFIQNTQTTLQRGQVNKNTSNVTLSRRTNTSGNQSKLTNQSSLGKGSFTRNSNQSFQKEGLSRGGFLRGETNKGGPSRGDHTRKKVEEKPLARGNIGLKRGTNTLKRGEKKTAPNVKLSRRK